MRIHWKSDWPNGIVLVLLTAHVCLALLSLRQQSVTEDEFAHLPAGLSYWRTGSFGIYRVNPPLVKIIGALPVLMARPILDVSKPLHLDAADDYRSGLSHRLLEDNRHW